MLQNHSQIMHYLFATNMKLGVIATRIIWQWALSVGNIHFGSFSKYFLKIFFALFLQIVGLFEVVLIKGYICNKIKALYDTVDGANNVLPGVVWSRGN